MEITTANDELLKGEIVTKDMSFAGIYAIVNMNNFKVYIGKSVNVWERICTHLSFLKNNKHYNPYLQNSFNKNNGNMLAFLIEQTESDNETLNIKEKHYINVFKSYHNSNNSYGYNLTYGGDGASGLVVTEDVRRRISKKLIGINRSKDTRQKISEAKKHIIIPEKVRQRQREVESIPIVQVTFDGLIKHWDSAAQAGRELGFLSSSIRSCCNKKIRYYNNSFWFNKVDYESSDFIMPLKTRRGKSVIQMSLDGELIKVWSCIREINEFNSGFNVISLARCCARENNIYKGYKWVFEKDYVNKNT